MLADIKENFDNTYVKIKTGIYNCIIKYKGISFYSGHIKKILSELGYGEIYYINGPETLPPPLTPQQEAEAVQRLDGSNSIEEKETKRTLVERNLRLVVYIAKRFENTNIGLEDLISIGTIGLVKAINTFKADKNIKLATYASRCIENEILMYIRKNSAGKADISLDEPLNVDWDGNELLLCDILSCEYDEVYSDIESKEEKQLIRKAVKNLPSRERAIISLRFGLDTPGGKELTQKEVADLLGISQSYISRLEKKIIINLKKQIISFYT